MHVFKVASLFTCIREHIFSGYKKNSSPSSWNFVLPAQSFLLRIATKLCCLLNEATKLFFSVLLVFLPSSACKGDCHVLLCSVGFLYYVQFVVRY